ncbi:hypothetical protein AB0F07_22100 [Streptomyces fructofermentans]|uniref:hypothetical protein n=1 Tax=Streptomyces fructofermentans TaxID=152141 RepID=UPI0033EA578A
MTSDTTSVAQSGQDSVVIASFANRHRAERMLASLGRGFRRKARKGGTNAVVIRGNADGSLSLTESRVLTANGLADALFRISISWMIGFMGLLSAVKGAKVGTRAAEVRKGHVGTNAQHARRILAEAGPHAAITLVRCKDTETRQMVVTAAAERARDSWDGSLAALLAALEPGSAHDWVRAAVDESSHTPRDQ